MMDGGRPTGYGAPDVAADTAIESAYGTPRRKRRALSGRLISFLVVAPLSTAVVAAYLFGFAADQYVSEFRFSVRQNPVTPLETGSISQSLTGGTSLLAAAIDSQIVVAYIDSHQIIDDLRGKIDLDAVYATDRADWLTRLTAGAPAEARLRYWRGMVDPYFDLSSGLISVKVRSFTPQSAQQVARVVLGLSETLVNQLSERSRQDKVAYTDGEVRATGERFRQAELAMARFRNAHGVLFPQIHATENATLDAGLREQIAQAEAEYQTLRGRGLAAGLPQMGLLQTRIAALRGQLSEVQTQLTQALPDSGAAVAGGAALATTLGGYDALDADDQIAERAYEHALSLQQQAHGEAAQQQVYLNAFVQPNLPESSLYPQRWRVLLEVFLAACVLWALGALLFYGVREHLD
jgi:capsular polysaccharide transport system permease protein